MFCFFFIPKENILWHKCGLSDNDITGSITKSQNDSLCLKLVHLWIFKDCSAIFHVFMKINEYTHYIICITYHRKEGYV